MDDFAIPTQLVCPTTGESFRPHAYRTQQVEQYAFLWAWCPLCDSSHRTAADPDFDAGSPQVHCFDLSPQGSDKLLERAVGEATGDG